MRPGRFLAEPVATLVQPIWPRDPAVAELVDGLRANVFAHTFEFDIVDT